MRLGWSGKGKVRSFYVYKSAYINGRRTTITVEKLGNSTSICKKYGVDDAEQWCRDYISKLNDAAKASSEPVNIKLFPDRLIPEGQQYRYNAGYLFLQQIYYRLGIHNISRAIARKHDFEYDLNSIFSRLVYSRDLYPASKLATCERSQKYIESFSLEKHQVYRALSVIASENDYIQSRIYQNSLKFIKRKTGVIFYDCTNFFYEIEEEDYFRRYGVSKEHRPNPIVQMGLFNRLLEKELGEAYTCSEIIDTLRNMEMAKVEGQGWMPVYTRTELTNALHEAFGFRTDQEIVLPINMKKICAGTKKGKNNAQS